MKILFSKIVDLKKMENINEEKLLEYLQESLQKEEKLNKEMKLENIEEWESLAIISILLIYMMNYFISK